ncbi:MAG: GYDIA family GHMP kinase [Saprospiraceae bacterium]
MTPGDIPTLVFKTRAHGKLLLTGEYFVLDGATTLAIPVRYGQSLLVEPAEELGCLSWTSKNYDDGIWFSATFSLPDLTPISFTDIKTIETLASILLACRRQSSGFLAENHGLKVFTQSDFPREWGLGTSSTLIAALAKWADVNPYSVLFDTMGGSGYDIACAYADGPVLYRVDGRTPTVKNADFHPLFTRNIFFVFLGKKQDSREGIRRYREYAKGKAILIHRISELTAQFLSATSLATLNKVIREHESLISQALDLPRAKDLYFNDFWGEIKSLGAWGGDFVLATSESSEAETKRYFQEKGFSVVLNWTEMVG